MMTTERADSPPNHRLNSWKEIAAFFGKDERTVKRWESQRGLPVHRLPGGARATVFAFTGELDQWLRGGRANAETVSSDHPPGAIPTVDRPRRHSLRLAALGMIAVVAIAALTLALFRQTDMMAGATFAGSTSATAMHEPPREARDLYLKGVYHWNTRSPDGLQQAVDLFNRAITKDPLYAEAYVGLANSYNLLSQYTVLPAEDAYPQAMVAAERAIELNDGLADAHAALAFTTFYWSRDIDRAQDLFERSLSLDPSSARTHHWYALVMMHSGLMEDPVRAISRAQELEPEARSILANKGLIFFYAGRTDEAVALLEDLRRSAPDFQPPHFYLATIYLDQERFEDYLAASEAAAELSGNAALKEAIAAGTRGYRDRGRAGLFAAMLATQISQHRRGEEKAFNVARTAALSGDAETAFTYLELSINEREPAILGIRIDPSLKALRADARFAALADAAFSLPRQQAALGDLN